MCHSPHVHPRHVTAKKPPAGDPVDPAERDAHLHTLGDLHAAGRLTVEELDRHVQATLAVETEEELSRVVAELSESLDRPDGASKGDPRPASLLRWVGAGAIVTSAAVVLTVVGSGSNAAEFSAALGAGALGFATHWALMTRREAPAQRLTTGAPGGDWGHRPAAQRSWEETTAQDEQSPTWSPRQAPHVPPRSLPTMTLPEQRRPSAAEQ